jgi:nucleotide-binding universal stress UspA family protein
MIPLARTVARAASGRLIFLRAVGDPAESACKEKSLREAARAHGAQLRIAVASDPAAAICGELARDPRALAALATHGRTAFGEAIMGSVALSVVRAAMRPVLLLRSQERLEIFAGKITTVAVALDGSAFSEKILPYAVETARSLSASLLLLHVLPAEIPLSAEQRADVLESSYLQRKAAELRSAYAIEAQWEVLHGQPGDAICRYLRDMPETLLAMTTHARPPLERLVLGSVAAHCVRHAGVPLLLYWPSESGCVCA